MSMGGLNCGKRLAFAGCRVTTRDAMLDLIRSGFQIDQIITVSPEDAANKYHISGYEDLSPFAEEHGIGLYHVEDYGLKEGKNDFEAIPALGIDLLVCLGWQRVVPKWLLESLPLGAIGMHGGPEEPPFGRGHSVMNWSLIEGRDRFLCYLFFYLPRVDAGPIVGTQSFDINPWDTCETLHFKYQLSMGRLLRNNLSSILSGTNQPRAQTHEGATYYPKRTPDDGLIDWNQPAESVHNLVRAVTKPYPGAFAYLGEKRLEIWRGQPFDSKITWNKEPGTVVEVFYNGKAVIQTRDYGFLLHDYEGYRFSPADRGQRLT